MKVSELLQFIVDFNLLSWKLYHFTFTLYTVVLSHLNIDIISNQTYNTFTIFTF